MFRALLENPHIYIYIRTTLDDLLQTVVVVARTLLRIRPQV
jgi:hypothetical protein